jgi:hypothetical protein
MPRHVAGLHPQIQGGPPDRAKLGTPADGTPPPLDAHGRI